MILSLSCVLIAINPPAPSNAGKNPSSKSQNSSAFSKKVTIAQYEFPSVEERFQYYMGGWYNTTDWKLPNCSVLERGQDRDGWINGRKYFFDHDLVFSLQMLKVCTNTSADGSRRNYCKDAFDTLRRHDAAGGYDRGALAAIFHFGDSYPGQYGEEPLPAISKARPALFEAIGPQPIIWPLNIDRHYGQLEQYYARYASNEVPWEDKLPAVVWRGKPTGKPGRMRAQIVGRWIHYDPKVVDVAFNGVSSEVQGFQQSFTKSNLDRGEMRIANMTRYKYLLSVEGNDVATGLKWMLYSNSVVFMPPPTKATWAMEDLLLPFVHYVPLSNDLSNMLEMIQWAEEHQESCREISARATDFVERLWLSDQARIDNAYLKQKLATTYVNQFHNELSRCDQEGLE